MLHIRSNETGGVLMSELGRLMPVSLREFWSDESSEFTPWLAKEDNLKLLGDTIGIELEYEAQEKDVGPFRPISCVRTRSTLVGVDRKPA